MKLLRDGYWSAQEWRQLLASVTAAFAAFGFYRLWTSIVQWKPEFFYGSNKTDDVSWRQEYPGLTWEDDLNANYAKPNFLFATLYIVASPSLPLIVSNWPTAAVHHFLNFISNKCFPLNGLVSSAVAVFLFWLWHWRRSHRTPKFRNSGDTAKANPLLDGRRREERKDRPVAWGTIRVWNPSDDSIVIEPTLLLHRIFFRRTSNPSRYLDTIELGPKENAEFQIEILEEVIPAAFRPLTAQFVSTNCWLKFTVTFEFQ